MKKILVITPFFYPHIGGSEGYMEELSADLVKRHHDVIVDVLCYNTNKKQPHETYRGLTIYRIGCWNMLPDRFTLPNPIHLVRFLYQQRDKYDLIHTSTRFFDSSWWAPIYARLTRTKIMLTDHCAGTPNYPNPFINFFGSFIDTVTGRLFLRLYDKVFVVSQATQAFLKQRFAVPSTVMYAGVDTKVFFQTKKKRGKRPLVIYAGRLIEAKGVRDLFQIAKEMPEADFMFVGPGELKTEMQDEVIKNRLKHITFTGQVDKKMLGSLLRSADIFVHPSLHVEGIPLTLIEAGISHLAVIATDVGGVSEVIRDGETGMLILTNDQVSLKKTLEKLITDASLRERLATRLVQHVSKTFRWEKATSLLYKEIEHLLQSPQKNTR